MTGREYVQTGIITGLMIYDDTERHTCHVIDCCSTKQRRLSHSSHGAEILACADTEDRGYSLRESIRALTCNNAVRHILHVESRALFDKISTVHDGHEYRLTASDRRYNAYETALSQ